MKLNLDIYRKKNKIKMDIEPQEQQIEFIFILTFIDELNPDTYPSSPISII